MIPELAELCLTGAVVKHPNGDSIPIDTVSISAGQVLICYMDWWRSDWASGMNLDFGDAGLLQEGTTFRIDPPESKGELIIQEPDLPELVETLADHRLRTDLHRIVYLGAMRDLATDSPEFAADIDEWLALFGERPKISASEEIKKKRTLLRNCARISLLDGHNRRLDVLVLDENGGSVVAAGNQWLQAMAGQWSNMKRRNLVQFVEWLAKQQPYGPYSLGDAVVFRSEGAVTEIAAQYMAS